MGTNSSAATGPDAPPEARGEVEGRGRLTGRRVLVVGGGQQDYGVADPPVGIGRAISRLLAREGAAVAIADCDAASAERSASEARAEGSVAVAIVADVRAAAEVRAMVADACAALGGLDGLVVNVGVPGGTGLASAESEEWDRVFEVNVRAHVLACRYALEVLPAGGAIVLMSSVAARMPINPAPAYHASKAALDGVCLWVAGDSASRRVRVNVVVPGLLDTPRGRRANRVDPSREQRGIPLGRMGTAWDVAYAVIFLLSDESSYITGQSLVVDGGLVALR
jgi:NAD(P)-dependent dehydrogenase (short-subunit alcohol dehydrogenase family)